MTANRKPVLNRELWIALDNAYNKLDVEWNWVKGHAGVKYNEICDQLCKMEITPEQFIETVGRTCYKSEDKITDTSAAKFVAHLI